MSLSFDVIFVGAGPASLSGALHLKRLTRAIPELKDLSIAVIEKAPNPGDQSLSGATLDPRALEELIPDYLDRMPPFGQKVKREGLSFLTKKHRFPMPFTPPVMSNKGKYLVSLSEFVRWLGKIAESEGVEVYHGEAVDELMYDDSGAVNGIVIKGKGLDKEGNKKQNYVEPTPVNAKVVVLGEGSRGHLTKRLIVDKNLDEGVTPQGYAVGLKELWEVREDRFQEGTIYNTMGYPLKLDTFGGSFIYHVKDRLVSIGLVIGLDYRNPQLHPFECLQMLKKHPFVANMLEGGRFIAYGAKTIVEGGWYAMPRAYGDGFLIIGESAGILDAMKLKGIDHVMKSGMLAAETIRDALVANDVSAGQLKAYEDKIKSSWISRDLKRARNFHQGFHKGIVPGMIHAGFQMLTFGRGLIDRFKVKPDYECMKMICRSCPPPCGPFRPDGTFTFDKLTCVFGSGTKHEDDQPCHIKIDDISICNGKCKEEYGNPCTRFCPANVFEMIEEEDGVERLHLNPSNCLHCKTCDIKDPYGIVTWVPPEGGGGPNYKGL